MLSYIYIYRVSVSTNNWTYSSGSKFPRTCCSLLSIKLPRKISGTGRIFYCLLIGWEFFSIHRMRVKINLWKTRKNTRNAAGKKFKLDARGDYVIIAENSLLISNKFLIRLLDHLEDIYISIIWMKRRIINIRKNYFHSELSIVRIPFVFIYSFVSIGQGYGRIKILKQEDLETITRSIAFNLPQFV